MKYNVIITINDESNYGNRLQNYALLSLLEKYGKTTTALCEAHLNSRIKDSLFFLLVILRKIKKIAKGLIGHCAKEAILRDRKNHLFTEKYIPTKIFLITPLRGIKPEIDRVSKVIIGSDQVWNSSGMSEAGIALRLGSFVHGCVPIISYAASFGISNVTQEAETVFQKYLPLLKSISVREDRGAELVKEMTGRDAAVVLDPTLMLTAHKWLEITENFVPDDDRYVLTYFLGRPSADQENDIQAYAKTHGCKVRRIFDLRDKETYVAGPQDFVELFSKAQYVFTDSYHACCFSILFHKQFTVFNRAGMTGKSSMNSRMETLFRLFNLNSVMMDSGLAPEIDYGKVDQLLERHRKESQDWLDKAMKE